MSKLYHMISKLKGLLLIKHKKKSLIFKTLYKLIYANISLIQTI